MKDLSLAREENNPNLDSSSMPSKVVTKEVIERRNRRLLEFFRLSGLTDVRIIGDENNPAVIYKNVYCLSCFVHNFELRFTNKPDNGEVVHVEKLTSQARMDKNELIAMLDKYEHRRVYRVKITDQQLYLAGYNFIDKSIPDTRYPVFSRFNPKIYFSKDYAVELCATYQDYNLEVV
jgi:hypothetical protein